MKSWTWHNRIALVLVKDNGYSLSLRLRITSFVRFFLWLTIRTDGGVMELTFQTQIGRRLCNWLLSRFGS